MGRPLKWHLLADSAPTRPSFVRPLRLLLLSAAHPVANKPPHSRFWHTGPIQRPLRDAVSWPPPTMMAGHSTRHVTGLPLQLALLALFW